MTNIADIFRFSDHLAVLKNFTIGEVTLVVASFNVLFEKWLKMNVHAKNRETGAVIEFGGHIGQFFKHLTELDPEDRKRAIFHVIIDLLMIHKVAILGLQEFDGSHLPMLREMLQQIGDDLYGIILPSSLDGYVEETEAKRTAEGNNDLQLIIYRKDVLNFHRSLSDLTYYEPDKPSKRIMNTLFTVNGTAFILVNTHVPFGKMGILVERLREIKRTTDKNVRILVLGDMNQEERPEEFSGSPGDGKLRVLIDKILEPSKFSHIDTKGVYRLYDHIWTI